MTDGQRLALEQLREIEHHANGELKIHSVSDVENQLCLEVVLSIDCSDLERCLGGIPIRLRERLIVYIPKDFPFRIPVVDTPHIRFMGYPHVQWKRRLCLYRAPDSEWDINDGMFGFIQRLYEWFCKGALGELDPSGEPLHPPVAYRSLESAKIIIRQNTPKVPEGGWFGVSRLCEMSRDVVEMNEWIPILSSEIPRGVAAAVLLSSPLPFEYPTTVRSLINELSKQGVSQRQLLLTLEIATLHNENNSPLYVAIGAPMRGISGTDKLKQHIAVWRIDGSLANGLRLALKRYSEHERIREIGAEVERLVLEWADKADVDWCVVLEDRPEIVIARDRKSALSWFKDRTVSVWGCGALGAHVAEMLARVGAKKLILRDKSIVKPGVLVRHPMAVQDIGRPKVTVLKGRLEQIRPSIEIDIHSEDILSNPLGGQDWTDGADVVIDTTASRRVLEKLELQRRKGLVLPIPAVSMVLGHCAEQGFVVTAKSNHSGGPRDVARKAKLAACNRYYLNGFANEFWEQQIPFQPEPGCSEPTFIGSQADVTALAGLMMNLCSKDLAGEGCETAFAHFVKQPHALAYGSEHSFASFAWPPDNIVHDVETGYEVRISDSAWREIRAYINKSARIHGARVETGGVLFGERADALSVIWADEVVGPPPDSEAAENGFVCGISGVKDANTEKKNRTRQSVQFVGLWHTHPGSLPVPSAIDLAGMGIVVSTTAPSIPKALLLIVGDLSLRPSLGAHVFSRNEFESIKDGIYQRRLTLGFVRGGKAIHTVGLALSGGGSRAIAFHLGCMRSLHDRGILDQLQVVSAVSGGSIIAGMYTYSHDSFEDFEERVKVLLRRGLEKDIIRGMLRPKHLLGAIATMIVSSVDTIGANISSLLLSKADGAMGDNPSVPTDRMRSPVRRWVTRTVAFENILNEKIFYDKSLTSSRRGSFHVVFNATELRTGSAFRFGSKETGCWRFGCLENNEINVARAVAASAAYPVLLPALDETFSFLVRSGATVKERVLLTDGGVFDNLGVTCLEPGRTEEYSYNVFHPEYVISCDAGQGQFSKHTYPYWWVPRMTRSFQTTFRKNQDAARGRLHRYTELGEFKGFTLAYLGQIDERLPYMPPNLVRREDVFKYPTNFSP